MKIGYLLAPFLAVAFLPSALQVSQQPAQGPANQKCNVPVFSGRDVDQKAKILAKPAPDFENDDRRKHARKVIVLRVILCGTGEVTDIEVKDGPSDSANAKAIEATQKIRFTPAEKNGQKVSTLVTLLYHVAR